MIRITVRCPTLSSCVSRQRGRHSPRLPVTSQFPSAFCSLFTLTELSPIIAGEHQVKYPSVGWAGRHRGACNPLAVVRLLRECDQTVSLFGVPFALSPSDSPASSRQGPKAGDGATETLPSLSLQVIGSLSRLLSPTAHAHTLNAERCFRWQKTPRSWGNSNGLRGTYPERGGGESEEQAIKNALGTSGSLSQRLKNGPGFSPTAPDSGPIQPNSEEETP